MTDPLDLEHQRRSRAERVVAMLQALWGDDLPDGPHPELTVLIDAVAIDDEHASSERLVSQGDGLTYDLLAALCAPHLSTRSSHTSHDALSDPSSDPSSAFPAVDAGGVRPRAASLAAQLPPALLAVLQQLGLLPLDVGLPSSAPTPTPTPGLEGQQSRLASAQHVSSEAAGSPATEVADVFDDPASRATAPATVPAVPVAGATAETATASGVSAAGVGMWEIDPQTRTVAFDAVTAALMGEAPVAGYASLDTHLNEQVHPADRARIEHAMQYALRTETTYRVRFRVISAEGVSTWLISQGRVLRKPSDSGARLTGYLILDRSAHPSAELVELA